MYNLIIKHQFLEGSLNLKGILDFGLNMLLWFFYYHTTLNTFSSPNVVNYHNFVVNTVIYVAPYIFSGICILWETENRGKTDKFFLGYLGVIYIIICLSFFSGISLEFLLQNRTAEDLKIGIPGLVLFTTTLPIEVYSKCLLIFPLLNYIMPTILGILEEKEGGE